MIVKAISSGQSRTKRPFQFLKGDIVELQGDKFNNVYPVDNQDYNTPIVEWMRKNLEIQWTVVIPKRLSKAPSGSTLGILPLQEEDKKTAQEKVAKTQEDRAPAQDQNQAESAKQVVFVKPDIVKIHYVRSCSFFL